MNNTRLGYACINMYLQNDPSVKRADRVLVNRSCIEKTFVAKGSEYAIELATRNLESVYRVLQWNEYHGIRFYRMSSNMFPHMTNPKFISDGQEYAYSLEPFNVLFKKIGRYAKKHSHRLTFHPGPYNQIGTPRPEVFAKTITDLSLHADILDRMGCDLNSILVVHGGGSYGDKKATMKRWVAQFKKLPKKVQRRLVIENCERQYNYSDVLWLSKRTGRPVVFDTHHHYCYSVLIEPQPDPRTFLPQILKTWTKLGLRPKMHISERNPEKKIVAHSDYVEDIPDYILELLEAGHQIDLMIEAKQKEQATLYLYAKYCEFDDSNWN